MTDVSTMTTLAELADEPGTPVIFGDSRTAVVLGRRSDNLIQLVADRSVVVLRADTRVRVITEPERNEPVVAEALHTLDRLRRGALQNVDHLRMAHQATLDRVRQHGIELRQDGHICLHGLNHFLRTFDLDEYREIVRVHYTIRGHFDFTGTDEGHARDHVEENVRPEPPDCYDLMPIGDEDYTVEIDEVEHLDHLPED